MVGAGVLGADWESCQEGVDAGSSSIPGRIVCFLVLDMGFWMMFLVNSCNRSVVGGKGAGDGERGTGDGASCGVCLNDQ